MNRSGPAFAAALLLIACVAIGCGDSGSGETGSVATVTVTDTTTQDTGETTTQQTSTTTSTATTGTDGAPPPADIEVTSLTGFTSPTGNIGCYIDRSSVRCDIKDRDWSPPPRPADCNPETDYGQGIELPAGGAPEFVCAGDSALDGGDPLPYGQSIAAGALRCDSSESDMSCTDTETGRGFTLSIQAYDLH